MNRSKPNEFPLHFAAVFSSGNLEATLVLYMPDGVLVDQQGSEHRGRGAIGKVLKPLISGGAVMSISLQSLIEYGNVAVLRNDFEIMVGDQLIVKSRSLEVLCLHESTWKLAIDSPYG